MWPLLLPLCIRQIPISATIRISTRAHHLMTPLLHPPSVIYHQVQIFNLYPMGPSICFINDCDRAQVTIDVGLQLMCVIGPWLYKHVQLDLCCNMSSSFTSSSHHLAPCKPRAFYIGYCGIAAFWLNVSGCCITVLPLLPTLSTALSAPSLSLACKVHSSLGHGFN